MSRIGMASIFALVIALAILVVMTNKGSYMYAWVTGQCFADQHARICDRVIRMRGDGRLLRN